jgi:uncharacterized membrane protein
MRYDEHDHTRTDHWVQLVLRGGMVLSMSVLLIGLALFALSPGELDTDLGPGGIADGLLRGDAIAVIDLGIVLLIATPLMRVLTTLVIFIADREPRFVLMSLVVLGVITVAVLTG